jgi:hypothetical protein
MNKMDLVKKAAPIVGTAAGFVAKKVLPKAHPATATVSTVITAVEIGVKVAKIIKKKRK